MDDSGRKPVILDKPVFCHAEDGIIVQGRALLDRSRGRYVHDNDRCRANYPLFNGLSADTPLEPVDIKYNGKS